MRARRFAWSLLLALAASLSLPACGGGGSGGDGPTNPEPLPGCANAGGPPITINGVVSFNRLVLTTGGLGPAQETLPARFVDVEIHDESGTCYGRTSSNASGTYSIVVAPPEGTALVLAAFSRTSEDDTRSYTVHNANPPSFNSHDPNNAFTYEVGGFAADGNHTVNMTVPYSAAGRPSIGFGLLDITVTCLDQVADILGEPVEPVHLYTRLGNNGTVGGSHYRPGLSALAITGGAAGNLDDSDTDYFDASVVAHELGHFLADIYSHDLSLGGQHAFGDELEPGFAWSEGHATGFGQLLIKSRHYIDSRSTDGGNLALLDIDNVTGGNDGQGIGGEATVAEIVYDLGDGRDGIPNADAESVAVPLADLYDALMTFDPQTDAPYLGLFLDRAVAGSSSLSEADVTLLMSAPEDQDVSYPLAGDDIWPRALVIDGGAVAGNVDSNANKAFNDCKSIDASVWYHLVVPSTQSVTISLTINTAGEDVDLFLAHNATVFATIASSTRSGDQSESITRTLSAGTYIVRAVASCDGVNDASFSISATSN